MPNTATASNATTLPTGGRTEPPVSSTATVILNTNSVTGFVYDDSSNDDGVKNTGEPGLAGVHLTLTGFDHLGNAVSLTAVTDGAGFYHFDGLRPSDQAGYQVAQDDTTLPGGYLDGRNRAGVTGNPFGGVAGAVFDDAVRAIVIPADSNQTQTDYDFGKLRPAAVSGYVYEDTNDNGLRAGSGEPGLGSVSA